MTEKTEKRIADTINIVTYVANDGTEFVSKDSCLAYEKKLTEIAEREKEVEKKFTVEPFEKIFRRIYMDSFGLDIDVYVGVLKNYNDYQLMKKYIKLCINPYEDNTEEPKQYPTIYSFSCNCDGYVWNEATKVREDISKYLSAIEDATQKMGELTNADKKGD